MQTGCTVSVVENNCSFGVLPFLKLDICVIVYAVLVTLKRALNYTGFDDRNKHPSHPEKLSSRR